ILIAARSRIAEDALAAAVGRGVTQYVVLGAGLDTFACRNPHAGLAVFEVDHPATQGWKRRRLAQAGLVSSATYAPVDFERETLADGLARAGFDAAAPAVFSWLGVVPYLTREAGFATLAWIAAIPGAEVVFDHGEPPSAYPPEQREQRAARAAAVARMGEPWITFFEPGPLAADLKGLGFAEVIDHGPAAMAERFLGVTGRAGPGAHVLHASAAPL
ncbi:MAG TPA: class I SAM-dependent methyltransferase, partial [Caulobacteraceae bacterium]|nr:class I SAM-dependent methyltransferase [Caulobacteraceae bacterium]